MCLQTEIFNVMLHRIWCYENAAYAYATRAQAPAVLQRFQNTAWTVAQKRRTEGFRPALAICIFHMAAGSARSRA